MNEIINKQVKRELSYDSHVILTYKIDYPQIRQTPYPLGKVVFNTFNQFTALSLKRYSETELFDSAKQTYVFNKEHGYPIMVYEVLLIYTITYNNKEIVSLYTDEYQFTGGAHGNTIRRAQNWNLETGRRIPLRYFFPKDPNYEQSIIKEINRQIEEQIKAGTGAYFDNYPELVNQTFNPQNYYYNGKEVIIFFQQYDIAPYSSGIPTFAIPIKN